MAIYHCFPSFSFISSWIRVHRFEFVSAVNIILFTVYSIVRLSFYDNSPNELNTLYSVYFGIAGVDCFHTRMSCLFEEYIAHLSQAAQALHCPEVKPVTIPHYPPYYFSSIFFISAVLPSLPILLIASRINFFSVS